MVVENDHFVKGPTKPNSGNGINNVKRQLDLIYNSRYELEIKESQNKFIVTLLIPNDVHELYL